MKEERVVSRREFLKLAGALTGGLVLGGRAKRAEAAYEAGTGGGGAVAPPEPPAPGEPETEIGYAYIETVRAEVLGVPVEVRLATDKTMHERQDYPVEKVIANREDYEDAESRIAEAVMRAHWHAWMNDNMEGRQEVSFEEYMKCLRQGEDLSYRIVASAKHLTGTVLPSPVSIEPAKPVTLVYTDRRGMIFVADNSALSLKLNSQNELVIELWYHPDLVEAYERYPVVLSWNPSALTRAGLDTLSLSETFQMQGVRKQQGRDNEASRIAFNAEFADMDDLLFPIEESERKEHNNETVIKAVLLQRK